MRCTETLKTRVSPEMKLQASAIADREFLSEAAWLKRLVIREIRARKRRIRRRRRSLAVGEYPRAEQSGPWEERCR
jgi:hypothetical protein